MQFEKFNQPKQVFDQKANKDEAVLTPEINKTGDNEDIEHKKILLRDEVEKINLFISMFRSLNLANASLENMVDYLRQIQEKIDNSKKILHDFERQEDFLADNNKLSDEFLDSRIELIALRRDFNIRLRKLMVVAEKKDRLEKLKRHKLPPDLKVCEKIYEKIEKESDEEKVEFDLKLADEFFPQIFTEGVEATIPSDEEKKIKRIVKTIRRDFDGSYDLQFNEGENISFGYCCSKLASFIRKGLTVDSPLFKIFKGVFDVKDIYYRKAKFGNTDLAMEKIISKIKSIDAKTGKEYSPELTRGQKREKIKENIIFIKETLRRQYELLADIARGVYEYLEKFPDASFLELYDKYLSPENQRILSPFQAKNVAKQMQSVIYSTEEVNKYYPDFIKDPEGALEKIFKLDNGVLKGPVELIKEQNILHFNVRNEDDYNIVYGEKDTNSTGGFAMRSCPGIPTLSGMFTVIKNADGVRLQDVIEHEQRHQINRFILSEERWLVNQPKNYPLDKAKDEIIAYLQEGRLKADIKDILTDENGVYNYFRKQDIKSDFKWEDYTKRVRQLIDAAFKVRKPDGNVDTELLAVTPLQHWKWLAENEVVEIL